MHGVRGGLVSTQKNVTLKPVFGYITAAVPGVILNLGIVFGLAVITPSPDVILWIPLIWMAVSFIILQYFKMNMIAWIGVSLGIGIIKFILQ